jgi:hypothetical protein
MGCGVIGEEELKEGVLGVRAINTKVLSILPPPITSQVVGVYCRVGGSGDGRGASSGEEGEW